MPNKKGFAQVCWHGYHLCSAPVSSAGLQWMHSHSLQPPQTERGCLDYDGLIQQGQQNSACILFMCSFNTASIQFFKQLLQKQTEKEGDSLSAWAITTHTCRSPHLQTKALCSSLLYLKDAQFVSHWWWVELLPPHHHLSLTEATQKHRRNLILSAPKFTCEWGGHFS